MRCSKDTAINLVSARKQRHRDVIPSALAILRLTNSNLIAVGTGNGQRHFIPANALDAEASPAAAAASYHLRACVAHSPRVSSTAEICSAR